MMPDKIRILIVDDEPNVREGLKEAIPTTILILLPTGSRASESCAGKDTTSW